ncbi:MAG TPA: glycoside hydrolase family 16 protein [Thermoanaerobaculia bacterium]|nr:glycoside hydrolase family 16 protein [Thermoanaerobaculia bacterium]
MMPRHAALVLNLALASLLAACASAPDAAPADEGILFDDFTYARVDELAANRWIVRTAPGWPGVPGASWGPQSVSLVDDPDRPGNRLLRMTSSTAGTPETTRQTQICHERKYLEGTYAARVRFTDAPETGPDGDRIVQTFYLISPLKAPMDLDYSETDFEYLPNGGWGHEGPTMFATTWETFHPEPEWKADNQSGTLSGSFAGWRTLLLQIDDGAVRYRVDGRLLADHGGRYYPEVPMSVNFNLWFIRDELVDSPVVRRWIEDIDWVYHRAGEVLTTAEVEAEVSDLRRRGTRFADTVPAHDPPLVSPCDF